MVVWPAESGIYLFRRSPRRMAAVDLVGDGGVLKRVLRAAPEGAAQPDALNCCAEGASVRSFRSSQPRCA